MWWYTKMILADPKQKGSSGRFVYSQRGRFKIGMIIQKEKYPHIIQSSKVFEKQRWKWCYQFLKKRYCSCYTTKTTRSTSDPFFKCGDNRTRFLEMNYRLFHSRRFSSSPPLIALSSFEQMQYNVKITTLSLFLILKSRFAQNWSTAYSFWWRIRVLESENSRTSHLHLYISFFEALFQFLIDFVFFWFFWEFCIIYQHNSIQSDSKFCVS